MSHAGTPPHLSPPMAPGSTASAGSTPAAGWAGLELALHPDDAAAFWRAPPLAALRAGGKLRRRPLLIAWLDGPDTELARAGRRLVRWQAGQRVAWRLEDADPSSASSWPPPARRGALAEAPNAGLLGRDVPATLTELACFAGVARRLALPPQTGLSLIETQLGTMRALTAEQAACRVVLEGSPREAFALARALAGPLRLQVPGAADPWLATTKPPAPPTLAADLTIDDALAALIAGLARALLYWAPRVEPAAGPEPVHQMRVALRRLRSALKLFGHAVPCCPELAAVAEPLRDLGRTLGAARDWDVFIAGLGAAVGAAFPAERSVARLLREAHARQVAAYAALRRCLDGAAFRDLGLRLAELAAAQPWRVAAAAGQPAPDLRAYARHALRRRLRKALQAGEAVETQPTEALHALRLQCKRLRYAAEFMAPLFPTRATRRFLRRLAAAQERLGRLNDGVVAAALVGELGGGAGRAFAAGAVRGYVAARNARARDKAERAWHRFLHGEPFWG